MLTPDFFSLFVRNLNKRLFHNLINISGLSVGLATIAFILLYSHNELTFDTFHQDYQRIFKVVDTYTFSDQPVNSATVSAPMGPTIVQDLPEIEMAVRINKVTGLVKPDGTDVPDISLERILIADSGFFKLFSFEMLAGDVETALTKPNAIVLSRSLATTLFGDVHGAIDKLVKTNLLGGKTMTVAGVCEDAPSNSHIRFDMLVSHVSMINIVPTLNHWLVYGTHTYIKLKPGASHDDLRAKFKDVVKKHVDPEFAAKYDHHVTPIEAIHLGIARRGEMEPVGNRTVVYLLLGVAGLILVLIVTNFASMSASLADGRIKEAAIRRIIGIAKSKLAAQQVVEHAIIGCCCSVAAVWLVLMLLSQFITVSGVHFSVPDVFTLTNLSILIVSGLLIGSGVGMYIAFRKALERPNAVFGSSIVVVQFSIVILLLISLGVVRKQLQFFQHQDPGFSKSNALIVPINSPLIAKSRVPLMNEFKKVNGVSEVATSSSLPSRNIGFGPFRLEGGSFEDNAIFNIINADAGFQETLDLRLSSGRYFRNESAEDSTSFVLNETAVASLGISRTEDALGKVLEMHGPNQSGPLKKGPIIGVVKDFNYKSFKETVEPLVLHVGKSGYGYYLVKADVGSIQSVIEGLKKKWNDFEPGQTMTWSLLEDDLNALYSREEKLGDIFTSFTVVTLLIGCVGLFGLSSLMIARRTREISIRKVLGATSGLIISQTVGSYLKMIAAAFVIASPAAWYLARLWLDTFVYHDNIGAAEFVIAAVVALITSLTAVSYQTWRAATVNPAKNLRSE